MSALGEGHGFGRFEPKSCGSNPNPNGADHLGVGGLGQVSVSWEMGYLPLRELIY